jgi:hypothetical protein
MGDIIWQVLGTLFGVGPVVLGMVFGMLDNFLKFKRWLQRPSDSTSERR